MNRSEYEVHMSLWAMLSGPLLAGNDLSKMTPETKAIFTNRDVIALDQDALGHQGRRIWAEGPLETWLKELPGGKRAIAFFNRGNSAMDFDPTLKALDDFKGKHLLDLWTKKEIVLDAITEVRVPSHGVLLLVKRKAVVSGKFVYRCLLLFGLSSALAVHSQVVTPISSLQLESSDKELVQAFQWAKSQALAYAHDGSDPVGPWYEAALAGRDSFCMRDVSHQTTGAAALGLYPENRNMLERFAVAVSSGRDWAGYWEIDRFGHPSAADYLSDEDFWYNLPANFDLLDSIVRMWRWTGDNTYLNDPSFQRFFVTTATAYVNAWDLQPDLILKRPRLMNQRLSKGKFIQARGIPSYTEGKDDFNLGTDLLAAEYRAFESLRVVAISRNEVSSAQQYANTANEILRLIEGRAWSEKGHHFMGFFSQDGSTQGSGDAMVLYFGATKDPGHIRSALSFIESAEYLKNIGIEEESYLAQTLYHYGEIDAAYERIMDITRPNRDRRDYPEVPFSVIGAIVTGMMGIEVVDDGNSERPLLHSISRLSSKSDSATLSGVRVRENLVDLEHVGDRRSVLTNRSGKAVHWQAAFRGRVPILIMNGRPVRAKTSSDAAQAQVSWIITDVPAGATVSVSRP
jgi:hypothetical protein